MQECLSTVVGGKLGGVWSVLRTDAGGVAVVMVLVVAAGLGG